MRGVLGGVDVQERRVIRCVAGFVYLCICSKTCRCSHAPNRVHCLPIHSISPSLEAPPSDLTDQPPVHPQLPPALLPTPPLTTKKTSSYQLPCNNSATPASSLLPTVVGASPKLSVSFSQKMQSLGEQRCVKSLFQGAKN